MKKFVVGLVLVALLVSPIFAQGAKEAAPRKDGLIPVTYVFPADPERLEDTPFWAAIKMGYFAEEGLDVKIEGAFGTTDLKMVATGNADFCGPGPMLILASIEEELPIKVISAYDAINIWGMCVPSNSRIQDWSDMRNARAKYGRKLTVALGDASWEMLVTPTLVAAGVDPKNDIEWVVAGENRFIQVAEGKLDMLFSWPGEAWQLVGQGFDFKYIDGDEVLKTNSNSIVTHVDTIKNRPEVVKGFVRALSRGTYFTKYNSEAAAALVCDVFPNIDVTWKAAVYVQKGRAYQMFGAEGGADEAKLLNNIGYSWPDKWQLNVDAALASGVIKKSIPLDKIYTNEFFDNTWDKAIVERDADNYDVASTKARYKPE
jgi:ABC-type nitrate/sulfonate/bicarbonate transport system substrate-binding protein